MTGPQWAMVVLTAVGLLSEWLRPFRRHNLYRSLLLGGLPFVVITTLGGYWVEPRWPQFVHGSMFGLGLLCIAAEHGELKKESRGPVILLALLTGQWLLWCGGFWDLRS